MDALSNPSYDSAAWDMNQYLVDSSVTGDEPGGSMFASNVFSFPPDTRTPMLCNTPLPSAASVQSYGGAPFTPDRVTEYCPSGNAPIHAPPPKLPPVTQPAYFNTQNTYCGHTLEPNVIRYPTIPSVHCNPSLNYNSAHSMLSHRSSSSHSPCAHDYMLPPPPVPVPSSFHIRSSSSAPSYPAIPSDVKEGTSEMASIHVNNMVRMDGLVQEMKHNMQHISHVMQQQQQQRNLTDVSCSTSNSTYNNNNHSNSNRSSNSNNSSSSDGTNRKRDYNAMLVTDSSVVEHYDYSHDHEPKLTAAEQPSSTLSVEQSNDVVEYPLAGVRATTLIQISKALFEGHNDVHLDISRQVLQQAVERICECRWIDTRSIAHSPTVFVGVTEELAIPKEFAETKCKRGRPPKHKKQKIAPNSTERNLQPENDKEYRINIQIVFACETNAQLVKRMVDCIDIDLNKKSLGMLLSTVMAVEVNCTAEVKSYALFAVGADKLEEYETYERDEEERKKKKREREQKRREKKKGDTNPQC